MSDKKNINRGIAHDGLPSAVMQKIQTNNKSNNSGNSNSQGNNQGNGKATGGNSTTSNKS